LICARSVRNNGGVDTLVGEESTMKPAEKSPKPAATRKKPTGFTDEERAAMREHLEEL